MFIGIYGSIYMHIRRIASGPLKTFLFAFLLFILVRGTGDTERFDFSLPMWAIVMVSLLIENAWATQEDAPGILRAVRFPVVMDPQSIPIVRRGPAG
jgi:hypothetical protein